MRSWWTSSEEGTRELGARLATELAPDGTLFVTGDLGSGKTVLAQGIAAGLGIDPREVQSPSFTLVREHEAAGGRLVHIDLYRLEGREVNALGLGELLAGNGVKVVEWAERLGPKAEPDLWLDIRRAGEGRREIVERVGTSGGGRSR